VMAMAKCMLKEKKLPGIFFLGGNLYFEQNHYKGCRWKDSI
jgi:hypothetical protein